MPMSSKFPAVSTGEKIEKIGQYLAKIWTKYDSLVFLGHPVVSRKKSISPFSTFIRVNNFFVCGPKYAKFFSPKVGWVVDDQELFRFLIC